MPRVYKNNSGSYSEDELVIAVWFNTKKSTSRPKARRLETFTTEYCPVAKTSKDLENLLEPGQATRDKPLLVPLPLAQSYLGWQEFYIPSEYEEPK